MARASASPTRSGPEGSSRNEPRLGRCPASHLRFHKAYELMLFPQNLCSHATGRLLCIEQRSWPLHESPTGAMLSRCSLRGATPRASPPQHPPARAVLQQTAREPADFRAAGMALVPEAIIIMTTRRRRRQTRARGAGSASADTGGRSTDSQANSKSINMGQPLNIQRNFRDTHSVQTRLDKSGIRPIAPCSSELSARRLTK